MMAQTEAQGGLFFGDADPGRHRLRIAHPSRAMEEEAAGQTVLASLTLP